MEPSSERALVAQRFGAIDRLVVKQERKWFEVIVSAELKNAYRMFDERGAQLFEVKELGSGTKELLTRLILGPTRPFEMGVFDPNGAQVLRLKRTFRFVFHHLEIQDARGTVLGTVEREWSWLRRIYKIRDPRGVIVARFVGPFFRPWTFEVRTEDGRTIGAIQKKWSGFGRELFTDADNFAVEMQDVADPALRALITGAVVLIDVVHFERRKRQ